MQSQEEGFIDFGGIPALDLTKSKLCIAYGEKSAKAIFDVGCRNVIWIPDGAKLSDLDKLIENNYGLLDSMSEIWLDAGFDDRLASEFARRLDPGRIRIIKYPAPYMSASLVLYGHSKLGLKPLGKQALYNCLMEAKAVRVEGVYEPQDFFDKVVDLYEQGLPPGHSLGFNGLTTESGKEIYTIATPSLNVFTGYYGSGKSEFIENIEIIMSRNKGWRWAIFNPETQPPALAIANLVEKFTKMPFGKEIHFDSSGRPRERLEKDTLLEAQRFVQAHFRFMLPQEKNFTVDNIIDMSSKLVKTFGIKGLVIDPFNQVEYNKPPQMREDIYIGQSLIKLNTFKRKHDLWIGVAAHPKTPQPNKNGEYPVPSIMALAGGMQFANMLDFGISVHRNKLEVSEPVQIHIQKVKFKHWGRLERGLLSFDLATSLYSDAKDGHGDTYYAGAVLDSEKKKRDR